MVCVTSKCCFCVPLWLGLLTWAFIKLIFTAVTLGITSITFFEMLRIQRVELIETVIMCYVVLLSVFTVIFFLGVLYRYYKFLFAYYLFSMFEVIVGVGCFGFLLYTYLSYSARGKPSYESLPSEIISLVTILVGSILLPIYFMVLIRSELLKIKAQEDETRVYPSCPDMPMSRQQAKKSEFDFTNPESQEPAPNMPVFPVEELERMIVHQLQVENV